MNIYEISANGWCVRVKATSFATAIRRGLSSIKKDSNFDRKAIKSLGVHAKVIRRNIDPSDEIPPFDG